MIHRLIPADEPGHWRAALAGIPHAFAHTWESCRAFSLTTGYRTFLYQYCDADAQVVCPVAERRYGETVDIVTPYGPSGFAASGRPRRFPSAWSAFAREQGWVCGYIALHPMIESEGCWTPEDLHRDRTAYVLDLTLPEQTLYDRLSENRKRQLRTWQRDRIALETDRERLSDFIVAKSSSFFRARGAAPLYNLSPETWRALLSVPDLLCLGLVRGGDVLAATVFAHAGPLAEYLFNISTSEGRPASAILMWEGAMQLKARGIASLNLGGGVRENDGVAVFKQRFGPLVRPLCSLKQIYDRDRFAELCRRAGVEPEIGKGYFPPYREPRP